MDAVIVAMDHMHRNMDSSTNPGVKNKRIIVLTDMGCPANEDKLETVLGVIKQETLEFTFLLPDWAEEDEVIFHNYKLHSG